jgi:hypothetical protein
MERHYSFNLIFFLSFAVCRLLDAESFTSSRTLLSLTFLLSQASAWEWDIPPTSGNLPSPRAGLTVSPLSNDQKQSVLCGGQNEARLDFAGCYLLSPLDGWKFKEVIGSKDTAPRSDHTALVYESNMTEVLILYGGVNQTIVKDFDDNVCEVFSTSSWSKVAEADCNVENSPSARYAHSASLVIGTLWLIFGGFKADGSILNDGVQALDLSKFPQLTWTKNPGKQLQVPPRAYHASASFFNSSGWFMVISGGQGDSGKTLYRDIWIFGPVTTQSQSRLVQCTWYSPKMTNSSPILYGHRIVMVGAVLYSFGGANPPPSGVFTLDASDLISDTETSWVALQATGTSPRAMFRSSITTIDADGSADLELLVFGGSTVGDEIPVFSGTLSVLTSAEGGNSTMRVNLPAILGGSSVAVLIIGAGLWFLLRNSNKSRIIRTESDVFSIRNQYSYQSTYSQSAPLVDDDQEEADDSVQEETLRFFI